MLKLRKYKSIHTQTYSMCVCVYIYIPYLYIHTHTHTFAWGDSVGLCALPVEQEAPFQPL